jgi:hypothetical protein
MPKHDPLERIAAEVGIDQEGLDDVGALDSPLDPADHVDLRFEP